jgi:hypothetical protein
MRRSIGRLLGSRATTMMTGEVAKPAEYYAKRVRNPADNAPGRQLGLRSISGHNSRPERCYENNATAKHDWPPVPLPS